MRRAALITGLVLLVALWAGPLRDASTHSFAAHMALHMGIVAIAAPLLGYGIAGSFDPAARHPVLFSPLFAAMLEFVVVWSWHMPALHQAARASAMLFAAEQTSFLITGLLVWTACLSDPRDRGRSLMGTLALLLTSMHMTLLGALIAFASRPLYSHAGHIGDSHMGDAHMGDATAQVADQQLGGVIMLLVGGAVYLAGGMALMARVVLADFKAGAAE
jgi:putative membrane protein